MVTNMHIPELEAAHGSLMKREYPQRHMAFTVQLFKESMTFPGQGKKVNWFLGLAWPGGGGSAGGGVRGSISSLS